MANLGSNYLSDGSLDQITKEKNGNLNPIMQILGTKVMTNNRIRSVISDGTALCQHCIFISDDIMQLYNNGQLEKFTVVRFDRYTISSLPSKSDIPVVLVNDMTVLKPGKCWQLLWLL